MRHPNLMASIARLQSAIATSTRLYRFIAAHRLARQRAASAGIERSARECWYDEAINDVEHFVIEGHPLPPEDA